MGCNSLEINEDKTEFVIFRRNPNKYRDITLQTDTDNIKPSDYVKILGVTLHSSLNMQKDIANTCRTTHMHIRNIRSIRCYLNEQATKLLVHAAVPSRLDYSNGLNIGLLLKSIYKLQLALNTGASPGFGRGGQEFFFSDLGICMSRSDMLRMAKPCALLGGLGGMLP